MCVCVSVCSRHGVVFVYSRHGVAYIPTSPSALSAFFHAFGPALESQSPVSPSARLDRSLCSLSSGDSRCPQLHWALMLVRCCLSLVRAVLHFAWSPKWGKLDLFFTCEVAECVCLSLWSHTVCYSKCQLLESTSSHDTGSLRRGSFPPEQQGDPGSFIKSQHFSGCRRAPCAGQLCS